MWHPNLKRGEFIFYHVSMSVIDEVNREKSKVIVGQEKVISRIVTCLFSDGHILIVGVPGLAKTLMANVIAHMLDLNFSRIQFTPDLMPADITGFDMVEEDTDTGKKRLVFQKGPIFTNMLLSDEINRASPKTQSALLEAMQERKVTVFGRTYKLDDPFFVMATQNPLEQEGTYPLPEAQLDRFMMQVIVDYPSFEEEIKICKEDADISNISPIISKKDFFKIKEEIKKVFVPDKLVEYIVRIVRSTRPSDSTIKLVNEFVEWGAGPRVTQHLLKSSVSFAYLNGYNTLQKEHIDEILIDSLRHRIILNYSAKLENVSIEQVIQEIVKHVSNHI